MLDNLSQYRSIVYIARLSTLLWSILAAWVIYQWSSSLFGIWAGVFSTALWCFDPLVLAFSGIATPDVPAAGSCVLSAYLLWRFSNAPTLLSALYAGTALGIAQLAKYTNLALFVLVAAIAMDKIIVSLLRRSYRSTLRHLAFILLILLMAISIINLCYRRQSFTQSSEASLYYSRFFNEPTQQRAQLAPLTCQWWKHYSLSLAQRLLPCDYLAGMDAQQLGFEVGRPMYLNGQWYENGVFYYYVVVLSLKLPEGTLVLCVICTFRLVKAVLIGRHCYRYYCILLVPLVIFLLASWNTGLNRHARYLLPLFPFGYIMIGSLLSVRNKATIIFSALGVCSIVSTLAIHPHYMSYINHLAGGPANGHRYLLGSSVDWGQDLVSLGKWLDRNPQARPIGLAYHGLTLPEVYQISYYRAPSISQNNGFSKQNPWLYGPVPGYFAVSVSLLQARIYMTRLTLTLFIKALSSGNMTRGLIHICMGNLNTSNGLPASIALVIR